MYVEQDPPAKPPIKRTPKAEMDPSSSLPADFLEDWVRPTFDKVLTSAKSHPLLGFLGHLWSWGLSFVLRVPVLYCLMVVLVVLLVLLTIQSKAIEKNCIVVSQ